MRREYVSALPEEIVRQNLILHLTKDLGFPLSHIALERGLAQMPHLHLSSQSIPDRRADLVCFVKGIHRDHSLYPLLLVECKAVKLTAKVIQQVVGYNHFLKACFIAVVNQNEIRFGWYDSTQGGYVFIKHIPPYEELLKALQPGA